MHVATKAEIQEAMNHLLMAQELLSAAANSEPDAGYREDIRDVRRDVDDAILSCGIITD